MKTTFEGRARWSLAIAAALVLGGCASGSNKKDEETPMGDKTTTAGGTSTAATGTTDTSAASTGTAGADTASHGDGARLKKPDAQAVLESRSGSAVTGHVNFYLLPTRKIQVIVEASGFEPNSKHGFHIHEKGDCSAPDGKSAGDHWNPGKHKHGGPMDAMRHAGDLGNIEAGADGNARLIMETDAFNISGSGDLSAIGKAVIIHSRADDLTSQPSGQAGDRIACGVVTTMQ